MATRRSWTGDILFLLVLAIFLGCVHHALLGKRPLFLAPANPHYAALGTVTAREVRASLDKPGIFLVDARPREAFAKATIPGSLSLPLHSPLEPALLEKLRPGTSIVFCSDQRCGASKELALVLQERGLNVKVFSQGIAEWRRLGYPVAAGTAAAAR